MEKKINIAKLLKDCEGMELDCLLFNDVIFDRFDDDDDLPILIRTKEGETWNLTSEGCWDDSPSAKCVIFPKGKTTWEGFVPFYQFKDGDVVATSNGDWIGITTGGVSGRFIPTYCVLKSSGKFEAYFGGKETWAFSRFATEEEKQQLFQAIKDNGYRWNAETKTLEKLVEPIFKVGSKVRNKNNHNVVFAITSIEEDSYICGSKAAFWFDDQDNYELVPNNFDISSLKPFDKVLVRDSDEGRWDITFYELYDNTNRPYPHRTLGGNIYKQCIPYEGNEHLMGKIDDCIDFYKTWE